MKSPFTGKEMSIHKEWRTMRFRKEEFKVLFHSYICDETGEQYEDEAFSELNYNQLVSQYRSKYIIPFPYQIIAIRGKYDISASRMSEILGFGVNSYRQYESGEIPSQSNARLIQLAEDPHEFKKLVDLCSTIETKVKDKILHKIQLVLEEQKNSRFERLLENYFFESCVPNSLTGFKIPSLKKFTEMVVFFTELMQPWKTKMNKLLFYSDFLMFKQTGFSISGIQYRAIPMGPVPDNFNSIYEYLAKNDNIDILYSSFANGGIGEQFKPNSNRSSDMEFFNKTELSILHNVVERFKNTSTNEIIEMSHKEKAWLENINGMKLIDYNYSFDLNEN
ncbi:MAG TPA: DUF4065 domain-containing protein [Bacteroidales bacterium]|nr:DUF4065 domain-containing protein [Bacteroidales bacterium]HQM68660.1 DUF4065 domain-containing protein [Bacteroidales bacterium]